MIKQVESTDEVCIRFTDEELIELGIEKGTKFSVECLENGTMRLTPFAILEIELSDLPRVVLERLIQESCDQDVSINEVVSNILKACLNKTKIVDDNNDADGEILFGEGVPQ